MSNWACNTAVTFRNGRVDRKDFDSRRDRPKFLSFIDFPERNNSGGPLHVPGLKVGINFERPSYIQFSHGFGLWRQGRLSEEEVAILQLINNLTDKKDWHTNVNDFTVCQTWREEAFTSKIANFPISIMLWEWCLFEIRLKGVKYTTKPGSISILDSASHVRKSDMLMGTVVLENLEKATKDLTVSPWMYPYIFRHTPVKADGVTITLDNISDCVGTGGIHHHNFWESKKEHGGQRAFYSEKSQWLATDVRFIGDENDNTVRIISPINNLNPDEHRPLYNLIESIISNSIIDWNKVLLYKTLPRGVSRIETQLHRCLSCYQGNTASCTCKVNFREFSAWADDRLNTAEPNAWRESGWNPIKAIDGGYIDSKKIYDKLCLRKGFADPGLQVYIEILKIEVEADGSISEESAPYFEWNINGNRNERIVATTLICLHRENIHPVSGAISFRTETKLNAWEDPGTKAKRMSPASGLDAAGDSSDTEDLWSEGPVTPSFQELGTVKLPQGRSISFPNALQHKFEVPLLNDLSCCGYIQLLQIHLVDPHYIVSSTRHVPPQDLKWWWKASRIDTLQHKHNLPLEIASHIVDFFLGPNRIFAGKSFPERLRIWHPYHRMDGKIWQEVPIRRSAALRQRRRAISKHGRVMAAVNGPRLYRPRSVDVLLRDMGCIKATCDNSDARDVLARPIPPPLPTALGPWDDDLTNAGEGSSRDQAETEEDPEEGGSEEETDESDSEDDDSEDGESDPMDFEDEVDEASGGPGGAGAVGQDNAVGEVDAAGADNTLGDEGPESDEVESTADEEFHDAVFYYFEGQLEALEQQDAQAALLKQKAREEEQQVDVFYDAQMVAYRELDEIE